MHSRWEASLGQAGCVYTNCGSVSVLACMSVCVLMCLLTRPPVHSPGCPCESLHSWALAGLGAGMGQGWASTARSGPGLQRQFSSDFYKFT